MAFVIRGRSLATSLWPGMRLGWIPIALALLAHVPGRRVYAANEALYGRPAWQFFMAGLFGDLLYVGPPVLLAFVVPLSVRAVLDRRRGKICAESGQKTARIVTALASVLLVLAWMFSIGAIESKLERGLYPTYLEMKAALGSTTFVVGSLPTLLFDRYRATSVMVLLVSGLLFYLHARWARRDLRSIAAVGGFALAGLLLLGAAGEIVRRGRVLFPRTGSYAETRSPIENVALGRFPFPNHTPITDGMRLVFASRGYSDEEKRAGVRSLGFSEGNASRLIAFEKSERCNTPHPLARPLDRPPVLEGARQSSAHHLLGDLEALSAALFAREGPSAAEPLIVWQIAMESFRGADIHALQPGAPPELTPVMTRLYDDRARTIAFRGAFQGGFRTAQNLSALQCGIGSLPFNIATARDLGNFPLRCLPDVLSDAGFEPRAFYARDMAYDSMLDFFRYHGLATTESSDMPPGLPTGSWRGVSDRALYDQALANASSLEGARSQYQFVLTLSGHTPFTRPTDMPAEVADRAAQACKKNPYAQADDCDHLAVIAYADYAFGEFLEKLESSPLGRRSIVVASADHATSEVFLFGGTPDEKGRAHVPYLVYVPRALAAAASHPEAVAAALSRVRERAATQVISLMDSPALMLALLSSTREVRSIPPAWRFHTLGAQATSPDFAFAARPSARVWGTDSAAFVFSADADGSVTAYENKNRQFNEASELDGLNPNLVGGAAFLSSFVKGYLTRCEGRAHLRMNAPR